MRRWEGEVHFVFCTHLSTLSSPFVTLRPDEVQRGGEGKCGEGRQEEDIQYLTDRLLSTPVIGKWYHFFRVAIKICFPGSGLYLIPTSTPLTSIPDRIRYSPKASANAKNQLHEGGDLDFG